MKLMGGCRALRLFCPAGLGDIIPVTDGGRILVCVWSFFGTALWLALLTSIVSFLCDFVYVELILNAYWFLRVRRLQAQKDSAAAGSAASDDNRTPHQAGASTASTQADQARADQTRAKGGKTNGDDVDEEDDENSDSDIEDHDDVEKQEEKKKKTKEVVDGEGREEAPTWKEYVKDRSLMNETLSWRSLFILNLVALTLYFVVHIICAGVFLGLEPHMGWLGENLTPHSYSTYFYASFTYSKTICTPCRVSRVVSCVMCRVA